MALLLLASSKTGIRSLRSLEDGSSFYERAIAAAGSWLCGGLCFGLGGSEIVFDVCVHPWFYFFWLVPNCPRGLILNFDVGSRFVKTNFPKAGYSYR